MQLCKYESDRSSVIWSVKSWVPRAFAWFRIGLTHHCHEGKIYWTMGFGIWLVLITIESVSLSWACGHLQASLMLLNVKENKAFLLLHALGCYMPFTATVSCLGGRRLQDMKYNREGPGTEICCVPLVRRQHRPFLTSARALLSRQCNPELARSQILGLLWPLQVTPNLAGCLRVAVGRYRWWVLSLGAPVHLSHALYSFLYLTWHPKGGYGDRSGSEMGGAICGHLWN